jgi:outer membrane biosynthesis protein TonB
MFGFIKKIFSGLAAFFGGILGGKKSDAKSEDKSLPAPKGKKGSGYFLELDETGDVKPVSQEKTSASTKAKAEPTASTKAKAEPTASTKAKAEPTASTKAKAEPTKTEKQPEPAKAAVATVERPKNESAKTEKQPESKKKAAAKEVKEVKVEAQPNPPAANNGKSHSTFAPNYLISPANNDRRRPGPSLDTFRDMARQVNTRNT